MKKNLIWCEVKCLRCLAVANHSGWYSPDTIKKLKLETKNWAEDADYSIICPKCKDSLNVIRGFIKKREVSEDGIS